MASSSVGEAPSSPTAANGQAAATDGQLMVATLRGDVQHMVQQMKDMLNKELYATKMVVVMTPCSGDQPPPSPTAENALAVTMDAKLMVSTGRGNCQKLEDLLKEDTTTRVVVMSSSSSTGEQPPSSPTAGNARAVPADTKLMVATGHGKCQLLKDLLNKEDANTMAVVMVSSAGEQYPSSPMVVNAKAVAMEAKLMMATGHDDFQQLKDLLNKEDATAKVVVMAPSTGEQPHSSPTAANALAVAMDAKLMMATSRGNCQKLKDLLNTKDATMMVVVITSSKLMNPLLLSSLCCGSWEAMELLFNREDSRAPPMTMPTQEFLDNLNEKTSEISTNGSITMHKASHDVEEGIEHQPALPGASLLLEGVTVEGDTALHVVARHGDGNNFLKCAEIIYDRAKHLLFVPNKNGDTPLHCAARAGKSRMVTHLIALSRGGQRLKELLTKENGHKETALHEAVRIGHKEIVELLMMDDPELACFPRDGTSPLYLAILLEQNIIADSLYVNSKGNLSYSGPNGQNALHAAVLRGKESIEKILKWNEHLTKQVDQSGSTPLHFEASLRGSRDDRIRSLLGLLPLHHEHGPIKLLLEANPSSAYQPDNSGKYPIHVAASIGSLSALAALLRKCPDCAGLRDAQGRTFLHVAVEEGRERIVKFACQDGRFESVLNMQDCAGNTALHLAVRGGNQTIFCCLMRNRRVSLNLPNREGQTAFDLSISGLRGPQFIWNPRYLMCVSLVLAAAHEGNHRRDLYYGQYISYAKNQDNDLKKISEATQVVGIALVLIVAVTFAAAFTLPGGFKADDHTNGGTPTLARGYVFDAFITANTFAFISSISGVFGFVYAGNGHVDYATRFRYSNISGWLLWISMRCLATTFALGVYLVLAPVVLRTAISVCVITSATMFFGCEDIWQLIIGGRTLRARLGIWEFGKTVLMVILYIMVRVFLPYTIIFGLPLLLKRSH